MRDKISFFIAVFPLVILLHGCGDKIEPGAVEEVERKVISVPIAEARVSQQPFLYEAVGTVHARISSTISGKLMGTVNEVNVREGDTVKKDDLLVIIDESQVSAKLRQAEAALAEAEKAAASAESSREVAKASSKLARSTYDRFMKLMKENSASQQEFDEAEARYRQAVASLAQTDAMVEAASHRVQQAEAAVTSARVSKKDAWVRAPYDGKVTAKMIDVGDLSAPGTPFLTLEKQGVYCVSLVLPEKHIHSVQLKQKVTVRIPSLQEEPIEGFIGRIDPSADQMSRSFRVRVALPENKNVRSGMFARVAIPVGESGMMLIPLTAIINQGQLTGVYLVDNDQIVHFRLIRTGRTFGDSIEVISGLKTGNRYVESLTPELTDGMKVEAIS